MRINEVDEISLKSNFWIINYEKFMKFDIFKTHKELKQLFFLFSVKLLISIHLTRLVIIYAFKRAGKK